jgi:allantoinase
VVTPDGVIDAVVEAHEGRITSITPAAGTGTVDAADLGDLWLLPGLVDTHVHINDPGRADWEGFPTATRAAAAGGVTTLVDMPLNSLPATCSAEALAAKVAAAQGRCHVDVAFWGGVIPGNTGALEGLAAGGVRGFKCFLSPSGVGEFPNAGELDLRAAMPVLRRLGLPLLAHAESPRVLDAAESNERARSGDERSHATWLAARPPEAECEAIALLIQLCRETGCRVHIVHVSAAEAIPLLRKARSQGLPITAETCPHYLVFDAEAILDGATSFKCAPPIRGKANRDALWAGLLGGDLDLVATDHSPCPPEMKLPMEGDFMLAWGGIASLELALSAMWTEAGLRGATLPDLSRWMSAAPARLAGLEARKGAIAVGRDADLVAFDPEAIWVVDAPKLHQRHKVSPYAGRTLRGRVVATWLRGQLVQRDGGFAGERSGRCVLDAAGTIR